MSKVKHEKWADKAQQTGQMGLDHTYKAVKMVVQDTKKRADSAHEHSGAAV